RSISVCFIATHTMRYHAHYHTSGAGHVPGAVQELSGAIRRPLPRGVPLFGAERPAGGPGAAGGKLALWLALALAAKARAGAGEDEGGAGRSGARGLARRARRPLAQRAPCS